MTDASSPTVFVARKIVTMNPSNPVATHVAVRDGRILGAGSLDELRVFGPHRLDETFADHVLVPGFVEAHSHLMEGAMWALPYLGYFPRKDPSGNQQGGLVTVDALIARLRELEAALPDPDAPLVGWGFDPIYFEGERLVARHLDRASERRPILLLHASLHLATANTAMLRASGIDRATETEGVVKGPDGEPVGELQEAPAMMLTPALRTLMALLREDASYVRLGRQAVNGGVTTLTDLASLALLDPSRAAATGRIVDDPAFPARLVHYCVPGMGTAPPDGAGVAERFLALRRTATAKHRFGGIKIVADGSIQGFTAVLRWPGYVNGAPNGLWQVPPDRLPGLIRTFHEQGINVHVHCNGDEVVEAMIDAVDEALRRHAWLDHRHTVQHCQLTSRAQYRRMARLGICGNLFANHLWFWGDQHYETTVGPERAKRLEACATAKREGVRFALHSDANVTPLGQLHTMWCAVNRVTPKGRVLGEEERISAYDALQAVTVDAAWQMHLDDEIGSIEVGKWADFTVLEADPLEVEPMAIRDIGIWGTVLAGRKFAAGAP